MALNRPTSTVLPPDNTGGGFFDIFADGARRFFEGFGQAAGQGLGNRIGPSWQNQGGNPARPQPTFQGTTDQPNTATRTPTEAFLSKYGVFIVGGAIALAVFLAVKK